MTEQVDCQTTSSDISQQVEKLEISPRPTKSLETHKTSVITPEKSVSLTLAERRNIPASTEKLRLYAEAQESQVSLFFLPLFFFFLYDNKKSFPCIPPSLDFPPSPCILHLYFVYLYRNHRLFLSPFFKSVFLTKKNFL
jgi:hypothetical protein